VKTLHVDTSFANTAITGPVYAQPLYLGGAGTSQPDTVVVATATNRVYALNATTGAEVWANMQYGAPITSKLDITGSNQPLNPMGVVGTPVIDPATRTLYFSAMTNVSNGARHRIHAVDLSNGMEKTGWPVIVETAATNADVGAFKAPDQNQRAALAVLGGRLFVPYSGHIGDAGPYHGWVVGVSTTAPTDVKTWATRATGGGIWGTSGIASDGTSIFFVTGNTMAAANGGSFMAPGNYGDGESVFKLSPSLTRISTMGASTDFFMPSDWGPLDNGDTDLGGTGIILFDVPGATPSGLILALGKDGYAYLLNRANLGGENATPLAKVKVSSRQIIQAAVVFTTSTGTYFVFRGSVQGCPTGMSGGLMAVKISGATLTPVWCGGPTGASNPIVSMSNAQGADAMLWVVATSGQVSAFVVDNSWASAFTGTVTATGTVKGHQSPIVANGRVYVQTDNRTYLLRP
jgi:hypothetical protein